MPDTVSRDPPKGPTAVVTPTPSRPERKRRSPRSRIIAYGYLFFALVLNLILVVTFFPAPSWMSLPMFVSFLILLSGLWGLVAVFFGDKPTNDRGASREERAIGAIALALLGLAWAVEALLVNLIPGLPSAADVAVWLVAWVLTVPVYAAWARVFQRKHPRMARAPRGRPTPDVPPPFPSVSAGGVPLPIPAPAPSSGSGAVPVPPPDLNATAVLHIGEDPQRWAMWGLLLFFGALMLIPLAEAVNDILTSDGFFSQRVWAVVILGALAGYGGIELIVTKGTKSLEADPVSLRQLHGARVTKEVEWARVKEVSYGTRWYPNDARPFELVQFLTIWGAQSRKRIDVHTANHRIPRQDLIAFSVHCAELAKSRGIPVTYVEKSESVETV